MCKYILDAAVNFSVLLKTCSVFMRLLKINFHRVTDKYYLFMCIKIRATVN